VSDQKRAYRKRLRAEQEEETRRRIVESAVVLHGTVGPSRTTMSALAEHAGVQRSTLYRHFADEATVFEACSELWSERNPLPDIGSWAAIGDPDERVMVALDDLYGFYSRNEQMLANLYRDAPLVPAVATRFGPFADYLTAAGDVLLQGRGVRGKARERTAAAIAHALSYSTWRSLVGEQRLAQAEAAGLMARLVRAAAVS
jgi:AcrR family transcriptional regulator